jgi:hypothetical protein
LSRRRSVAEVQATNDNDHVVVICAGRVVDRRFECCAQETRDRVSVGERVAVCVRPAGCQRREYAGDGIGAVVVDDRERLAADYRRSKAVEVEQFQRNICTDRDRAGHVDLVMVGVGCPGIGAADFDFVRVAVGEGEVAIDCQDARRLTRRDGAVQRHSQTTGDEIGARRCIVDFATGDDRHRISKRCRVDIDVTAGRIADRD